MSHVVIRALGFADQRYHCGFVGCYLEWVRINDPADKPLAGWTPDINKAMRFKNIRKANEQYREVRTIETEPGAGRTFDDGKPNRPLTAITVEFLPVQ